MMIDNKSRFCMSRELYAETGSALLHCFTCNWVAAYGVPQILFADAAPVFTSKEWSEWTDLHGVALTQAVARNQWQNGLCERAIDTVKQLAKQLLVTKKVNKLQKAVEHSIFVKNSTPTLGTLLSPFTIMTGRPTIFGDDRLPQLLHLHSEQTGDTYLPSLMEVYELRRTISEADAASTVALGLAKQLRSNMNHVYHHNDKVQIWDNGIWAGTYLVLAHSGGSNLTLEKGNTFSKFPTNRVRPLTASHQVRMSPPAPTSPNEQLHISSPDHSDAVQLTKHDLPLTVIREQERKTIADDLWCGLDLLEIQSQR